MKPSFHPFRPILAGVLALLSFFLSGCQQRSASALVLYTSQDQVYAEPILDQFTRETGIPVRAVFDSEAVKTVGLANRLLAEKTHPRADVFWNNEELRTRQLAREELFVTTPHWTNFGFRLRQLVINTHKLPLDRAPGTLADLTNATWTGKVALAYPLFGTTATHFLALRQHWGTAQWEAWCRQLQANQPFLADGNSGVVKLVGRGEAWVGLTDSDDVQAGLRQGLPIAGVTLPESTLIIPNTVAVLRGAPHPAAAAAFVEFLLRPETVQRLVAVDAIQGPSAAEITPQALRPNWEKLLDEMPNATATLKSIFLR